MMLSAAALVSAAPIAMKASIATSRAKSNRDTQQADTCRIWGGYQGGS